MAYGYDHDRRETDHRCDTYDAVGQRLSKPYCARLPDIEASLWRDFDAYLVARNLSPRIARANLWYPSQNAGDDSPRIVMPASSDQDANHFWQARLMGDGLKRYESPHGCRSGDATIIVYPQQNLVFTVRHGPESAVVEGPMCALAVAMTGRLGVATMGASPPEERLDLIFKRVRGTLCYVIPDRDRQDLFIKVFVYLVNRGIQCRWQDPGPHKDFAEMSPENRRKFF